MTNENSMKFNREAVFENDTFEPPLIKDSSELDIISEVAIDYKTGKPR